jgi:hypothetical protein
VNGHVHGDDVSSWPAGRMSEHLRTEHHFPVPMFWSAGRLHTEHLKSHDSLVRDHLAAAFPDEPVKGPFPMPEKTPMTVSTGENPVVGMDRIICALAGIDFEEAFVRDESGNLRGALRKLYKPQAQHLLDALDRGELADLVIPVKLFRRQIDQLAKDKDKVDEVIRERDQALRVVEHAWQKLEQAHGTCTEAHLGLATTRELLDELTARIEVGHGGLDYRTVDGDL